MAAEAVGYLHLDVQSPPKLIETVQKLLHHAHPAVRAAAVKQLSGAPPTQAIAALRDGIKDGDQVVRIAAAAAVRTLLDAAYSAAAIQEARLAGDYPSPAMLRDRSKMPKWILPSAE